MGVWMDDSVKEGTSGIGISWKNNVGEWVRKSVRAPNELSCRGGNPGG